MRLLLLILTLTAVNYSEAQVMLEGKYLGSNLYVQNSLDAYDAFCVDSIIVNGTKYSNNKEFMAFEIKLDSIGLTIGDPLEVTIYHKNGCRPKVLNRSHSYQPDKVQITEFRVENTTLSWKANELIPGRFEIQVYRWNKWMTLDSIQKGLKDTSFQFDVQNQLHSGVNQFRIRFVNRQNQSFYSKDVQFESNLDEFTHILDKKTKTLQFSNETRYEIYDEFGLRILKGQASSVNLERIPSGIYYVNFDNRNIEIKLKH